MAKNRSKRISGGTGWSFNAADEESGLPTSTGRKMIRLRMEKRKGKPTTILYDMEGIQDMKTMASNLKSLVSAGGTTKDGRIEIQGEHRERFRVYLSEEGFEVKG